MFAYSIFNRNNVFSVNYIRKTSLHELSTRIKIIVIYESESFFFHLLINYYFLKYLF